MNKNIIIAGVGGQGILTIASIIDLAAMNLGLNVKQAEVHGMSQRGGAVESHLRISSEEIFSDLIPLGKADLILSIEPMEALRYLPFLSPTGVIVTATEPYKNIPDYPDEEKLMETISESTVYLPVEAGSLAKKAGSPKTFNVVMLGAASPYLGIKAKELEKAIGLFFERKGEEIIDMNIKAFRLGKEYASE
ncbi:indolepyruvate ferredoxin oxidoreductase beta subunit [Porphyromonadaceae bacterium NLAE-zl-C104]|uniref:indolepyruvate oxidoreductase subunit beta n=1 Tax=Proteiniphilum sp. TaxID=1926877 RepID=UPI0008EBE34F|nr:indolepyruvate oxidoreductase subunit beta [Proteiniphilum sp.]MDY9919429.1 indolepyruvate oxidoreductase subunit beta [Proteiniphilum sp.]SFS90330.1 indolepyruvate ferredoxin oxidoreductase beta subunit [Porphyromonadaceae bacterium NLAE-zl-C104]